MLRFIPHSGTNRSLVKQHSLGLSESILPWVVWRMIRTSFLHYCKKLLHLHFLPTKLPFYFPLSSCEYFWMKSFLRFFICALFVHAWNFWPPAYIPLEMTKRTEKNEKIMLISAVKYAILFWTLWTNNFECSSGLL